MTKDTNTPVVGVKVETVVQTNRTMEIKLNRVMIIGLLKKEFQIEIPWSATVYVHIPGGGDWSNEELDINDSNPVTVTWTTIDETSSSS